VAGCPQGRAVASRPDREEAYRLDLEVVFPPDPAVVSQQGPVEAFQLVRAEVCRPVQLPI